MRLLVACGGTAGHIFPGLALIEELKKEKSDCQITVIVSKRRRDQEYLKAASSTLEGISVRTIISTPLPYKPSLKYIVFALRLLLAFFQSLVIILKFRPQVVIGFGGYVSFAPLAVAWILKIPRMIHEQNLVPGRTNQALRGIVDKIAVSFDQTHKFFLKSKSLPKIVATGLPLRRQILNDKNKRSRGALSGLTFDKFTILIMGGSQGSHSINELVFDCLKSLDKTTLGHLQLIHITGKRDFHSALERYKSLDVSHHVFDFLEDIAGAYRVSDLLISRSGASAIFEAASFGLPSILIPYSHGTQHQKDNAAYLKAKGAALILDDETSAKDLGKLIFRLVGDQSLRENLSRNIKVLAASSAAEKLKNEVLDLYKGRYVRS